MGAVDSEGQGFRIICRRQSVYPVWAVLLRRVPPGRACRSPLAASPDVFGLVARIPTLSASAANRDQTPRFWTISAPTTRQISSYEKMWCELVFREDENTSHARASAPTGHGLGRRWPPPRIPTRVPRCGVASWRVEHPFAGGGFAPRLTASCVRRARPSFDAHLEAFQPSHDR